MKPPAKPAYTGRLQPAREPAFATAMLALMDELMQIMNRECELVQAHQHAEREQLAQRKLKLCLEYQSSMKSLSTQPEMVKQLADGVRDKMRKKAAAFAEAAKRNALTLKGAVTATEKLLLNVMALVKQEALPQSQYVNHKKAHLELGNHSPTCEPIAVSRTV